MRRGVIQRPGGYDQLELLDDVAAAHRELESGLTTGKLVLVP